VGTRSCRLKRDSEALVAMALRSWDTEEGDVWYGSSWVMDVDVSVEERPIPED
jgi:hypothetical protein